MSRYISWLSDIVSAESDSFGPHVKDSVVYYYDEMIKRITPLTFCYEWLRQFSKEEFKQTAHYVHIQPLLIVHVKQITTLQHVQYVTIVT